MNIGAGKCNLPKMDEQRFLKIKAAFERHGGIMASAPEIDAHLERIGAESSTLNQNTILIKTDRIPSASAVYEELIHTAQFRDGQAIGSNWIDMEIEAKVKLIKYQKYYQISDAEHQATLQQLRYLVNRQRGE